MAVKYYYDKWNRIVREDNHKLGKTCTWEYDVGGNITEKRTYALCTTEAVSGEYTSDTYVYATNGWNDQLISFNGEACTYDALGNPTTYRGHELEWTKVRRLAKFGDVEFTYNADGLRTSKTVNGVTHSYLLSDSKILQETFGSSTIKYYYGHGDIVGFNYNGTDYYYRKNLQGDIIEIYTASGTKVAGYEYDAWGNHKIYDANGNEVTSETHIGCINPIRYRGYYYDVETGLYYVASRYYDAEVGRFILPDTMDVLSATPMELTDKNLYAYCDNNPVSRVDTNGYFWHLVVGGVIGGIIGAVSSAVSGGDIVDVLIGAAAGAAGGVLAASGAGVVVQALGSAAISMTSNAASQVNHIVQDETGETEFKVGDMLFDGAVGLVSGAWGGNGASYGNTAGIKAATKQLFKRGFFNPQARSYYAKVAHNMGGEYVFVPLLKSLGKSAVGSIVVTGKNILVN